MITARWVLAWRDGGHALIPDGEIVVERNEVLYAGPRFEGDVARRIDFGTALVSPGLIDLDALSDLDTYLLVHDNQPGWAKGASGRVPTWRADLMRCIPPRSWRSRSGSLSASCC